MNLRNVTIDDWKILLDWRNDIETRMNSHNTEFVEEETHKNWLRSILKNKDSKFFIALENEVPVGTVRANFESQTNEFVLSWTISPDARGKGIGKQMVKLVAETLNAKIRAEVKVGNVASIKIAEYAGLVLRKEENNVLYFSN